MKRFMCIFSAFMLLVGCVKNDPVTPDWRGPKAEIAFECPVAGPKMKSVYEVADYPADLNFRVWGYFSESQTPAVDSENHALKISYIDGAEFANVGDLWGANDGNHYYWPTSGYLHFIAHAPSEIPATSVQVTDAGLQINGYTVPDAADQDLMVSQVAYGRQNPGEGVGSEILFDHALSSISFAVKSGIYVPESDRESEGVYTDLRVTKIELFSLKNTGDFDQAMTMDDWTSQGQMTSQERGWNSQDGSADYVGYDRDVAGNGGFVLSGEYRPVHDQGAGDSGYALTNLILMPQDLSSNQNAILKVTYEMTHTHYADNNGEDELWVPDQTAQIALKDCGVQEWLRGYRYTYNITLSRGTIQCSSTVDAWEDTEYEKEYDSMGENMVNDTLNWQN